MNPDPDLDSIYRYPHVIFHLLLRKGVVKVVSFLKEINPMFLKVYYTGFFSWLIYTRKWSDEEWKCLETWMPDEFIYCLRYLEQDTFTLDRYAFLREVAYNYPFTLSVELAKIVDPQSRNDCLYYLCTTLDPKTFGFEMLGRILPPEYNQLYATRKTII